MPIPSQGPHRKSATAFLLVALLGVMFGRRPDAFLCPQFWAEDFGFLIAAEQQGWASLVHPQTGYLHTLPRLIALAATLLDPILQPATFLLASILITLGVCAALCSPRLELPFQPLLAVAVVVVPHTGEVFFNPTHLQWIVALGILGTVLKQDPHGWPGWCVDLGFLIVGGLTGPMMLFAWPILLARFWRRRSRASATLFLVGTATAAIQLFFAWNHPPESTGPLHVLNLGAAVAFHLFCSTTAGVLATPALPKVAALALAALIAAFVGFVVATSDRHRPALRSLLLFAILVLTAAALHKRMDEWSYGEIPRAADRYLYVPRVILLWLLTIGAVASARRWVRHGSIALLACAIICNLPRFQFAPHPDRGWYEACPRIRAGEAMVISINPDWKFYYQRGTPHSRYLTRREQRDLGEE